MGIVIAQPDMVSGQVSAGYGAAEQWSKDLPTLERQQEAISHANLTSAQIGAQSAHESAALLQRGQMFSAQQQAQAREQQYGGEQAIAQQAYGIQGQLQQQQQHAELAAWVNSQEMTQADQMRLQRLQQSLSAVQASDTLTPQEKADLSIQLRTGIDPLQKRQEAQKTKLLKQQEEVEAEKAKTAAINGGTLQRFNAQGTQEHTSAIYSPSVLAELGRQYDEANPQLVAMAKQGGPAAMAAYQATKKEVVEAMAARDPEGIIGHSVETAPGKKEITWKKEEIDKSEQIMAEREKRFQTAQDHYAKHYRDVQKRIEEKFPDLTKDGEELRKRVEGDLNAQGIRPPTPPEPVAPKKQKAGGNPFMPKSIEASAPAPPTQGDTVSPGGVPAKTAVGVLDNSLSEFNQRPVNPEVKLVVNAAFEQSKALLAKAGGYDKLDAHEKKIYDHNRELIKRALATAPPVQPPPPVVQQPIMPPIGSPDPRSSIYMRQR